MIMIINKSTATFIEYLNSFKEMAKSNLDEWAIKNIDQHLLREYYEQGMDTDEALQEYEKVVS